MIQLDPVQHVYWDDADPAARFVSVSQVIRLVGLGKSFDGSVEESVLTFARERGIAVENILYSLMRGETAEVEIPKLMQRGKTLRESVMEFVPGVQRWIDTESFRYQAHQVIVADYEAGIAGTLDLCANNGQSWVIDVKATANEEKDWKIQVGAYLAMIREDAYPAVLHINPKYKKGYIFREYDRGEVLEIWGRVREAWMESRALFASVREAILK